MYQAAVISVFAVGYSLLAKKVLKLTPPSIQKFDLEDTRKLVAIVAASEMTRECLIKQKIPLEHLAFRAFPKMVSIAMLIGGALVNALAFTGNSYMFSRLSKDSIDVERKWHDMVIEQLQKVRVEWVKKWQEQIDFINKQLRLERKAETRFTELNDAVREYHEVFGHELSPLPQKLVLSDIYTPSNEQHDRELAFIACLEHDWDWRCFVVLRMMNYIMTHSNIILLCNHICIK